MKILLGLLATAMGAGDAPVVEYVARLHDAPRQVIGMTMIVRETENTGVLDVALPAWRPGRYEILDPAGTVRSLMARTGSGQPLPAEKIAKSTWRISTASVTPGEEVVIDYEVYAHALGNRTRHADDTHAFLSPSAVFLFVPGWEDRGPVRVTLDAPSEWGVATGLDPDPEVGDERVLRAASYHELVDSPIEVGVHEAVEFEVDGVGHRIVLWSPGGDPGYPLAEWPDAFAKIVRQQRAIFGRLPYRRYVFLVHCYPGGSGGTEHVNSTVMQASPSRLENAESFRGFLGLVSHEFFHTWNVKQFRPAGLKPYDYLRENYTRLLWVAEGTTTYYADLVLARAGLLRVEEYLRRLGASIDAHRRRPGTRVQSLEESSFDAWIKFNKTWPDSANSTVSFYDAGALASLALDLEIRRWSEGAGGLDEVMRGLFERFPLQGPAYTTDDVRALVDEAAGVPGFAAEFLARHVAGVEPIDFERILATAGLELVPPSAEPPRGWVGLSISDKGGWVSVDSVSSDGPAYAAGIHPGDLLIALDGQRVTPAGFEAMVRRLSPGQRVRLTCSRHERLREVELEAAGRPEGRWNVRRIREPTDLQRRIYESWLGQPWPEGGTGREGRDVERRPDHP